MPRAPYQDRRDNRASFFREKDTGGDFRPGALRGRLSDGTRDILLAFTKTAVH
jgi:hypothetical protein